MRAARAIRRLTAMGGGFGDGRWWSAAPRALRADLWTLARDPLPRRPFRWFGWWSHVLVVASAVLAFLLLTDLAYASDVDVVTLLLGLVLSAAMVTALFRPVLAWWTATLTLVVGALAAGPPFPWGFFAVVPLAEVLFLMGLRVRPRAAAEALALSVLGVLASTGFQFGSHPDYGFGGVVFATDIGRALLLLAVATGWGVLRRARRVTGSRLLAQKNLAADERARRTVLEERGRIARELHDVVAHHLSVISIQAQVAPHLAENPSAALTENLTGIRQNALDALVELRRVLGVLRLEDSRSAEAQQVPQPTLAELDELIANVRAAGVAVTIETVGVRRPLSPGVELSAFRLVQEALSNAMRHAPGAAVRVVTTYEPAGVTMRISNAAPARPAPPSPGSGHGLLGMRERTTMLGGTLTAGPTADGGYAVTATLPAPMP